MNLKFIALAILVLQVQPAFCMQSQTEFFLFPLIQAVYGPQE
jgi:hypothetical protein